jgi:NNP family nitrate/nitrite transporter-like MFS transporter
VGGLGAFGGFVIPPVMAFAVRNLGQPGYAIGFITFIFLALFSLSMAWILKYAREEILPQASPVQANEPSVPPAQARVSR